MLAPKVWYEETERIAASHYEQYEDEDEDEDDEDDFYD